MMDVDRFAADAWLEFGQIRSGQALRLGARWDSYAGRRYARAGSLKEPLIRWVASAAKIVIDRRGELARDIDNAVRTGDLAMAERLASAFWEEDAALAPWSLWGRWPLADRALIDSANAPPDSLGPGPKPPAHGQRGAPSAVPSDS